MININTKIGNHVEKIKFWNPITEIPKEVFDYIDLSSINKDSKQVEEKLVLHIKGEDAPSRARQKIKNCDILVSTVRPNLNGVAILNQNFKNGTASTGYCVLRPKSTLYPKYLFYWVQTKTFVEDMISKASGASYPAVSDKIIKESKIPLPPLETQQKIAAILDAADAYRQKTKTLIEKYDQLAQSLFLDMFGDPVNNPKGWDTIYFMDLFNIRTGKLDSNCEVKDGKYPFFTCAKEVLNIDTFSFDMEALLLAGNNAAGVYDVKYYYGKFNAYQRTYILSIKPENQSYSFFKLHLEYKLKDLQRLSIGTGTKYLTMQIFERLSFISPPFAIQNQFSERIQLIEAQKQQAQASLQKAEDLFNSLLQRAFNGELVS